MAIPEQSPILFHEYRFLGEKADKELETKRAWDNTSSPFGHSAGVLVAFHIDFFCLQDGVARECLRNLQTDLSISRSHQIL